MGNIHSFMCGGQPGYHWNSQTVAGCAPVDATGCACREGQYALIGADLALAEALLMSQHKLAFVQIANDNADGQIVLSGSSIGVDRAMEVAMIKACAGLSNRRSVRHSIAG